MSFHHRLKEAMGERGYEHCMRRSVQTVILYEAYRCISDRLPSLRPFQRKLAFFDQTMALVDASSDYLLPHQQEEIMWRTGTSKEPMQPETAWKRMKLIEKEVEKVIEKIRPLCEEGRTHEEVCTDYIQQQYEIVAGQKGKPYPPNWEHAHNNIFMGYRMYYRGTEPDPTFPPPEPPKEIVVPASKPKREGNDQPYYLAVKDEEAAGGTARDDDGMDILEPGPDRRLILEEVREHLNLLKEFEGVISEDALNKRKRELFATLPSAPPSTTSRNKLRREDSSLASAPAKKQESSDTSEI